MRRLRRWLALGAAALSSTVAVGLARAQSAAPPARSALVVPAGSTIEDGITVLKGDVVVDGTVRGDVFAVAGDVVVNQGGVVRGDVVSVFGDVDLRPGGTVTGSAQPYARPGLSFSDFATSEVSPWRGLTLTLGWLALLLLIGIGVLVAGSTYLDGVAETLQAGVGRALAAGLAAEVLLLPALITVVVLLAVTVVGVLAIPLGVVAFVLAAAGLLTLGFLAVAFVTGRALVGAPGGWRASAARGAALRALTVGLIVYLALWFAAAALQPAAPVFGLLVRVAALGLTWVAVTAGFGATILSRAGTRAPNRPTGGSAVRGATGTVPVERDGIPVWQTPTPIGGIVAARRPTAVPGAAATGRD